MHTVFTDENFDQEVLKSDLPVLVDFYADWCGPCKMLGPIIEELADEYKGKWKIGSVDIDASPDLAAKYGVTSIPTLKFFKDGQITDQAIGFQAKEKLKAKMG